MANEKNKNRKLHNRILCYEYDLRYGKCRSAWKSLMYCLHWSWVGMLEISAVLLVLKFPSAFAFYQFAPIHMLASNFSNLIILQSWEKWNYLETWVFLIFLYSFSSNDCNTSNLYWTKWMVWEAIAVFLSLKEGTAGSKFGRSPKRCAQVRNDITLEASGVVRRLSYLQRSRPLRQSFFLAYFPFIF